MLLDDENVDDYTVGSRYNNYDNDYFDSSVDEAITCRMKLAKKMKRKTPPSDDSDGNGHSTSCELIVNNAVSMNVAHTASNTSGEVDDYSFTSCLLLDSCKDGMVGSISRDDEDEDVDISDPAFPNGKTSIVRQQLEGTRRKRRTPMTMAMAMGTTTMSILRNGSAL